MLMKAGFAYNEGGNFTIVNNDLLNDDRIGATEKFLHIFMASKPKEWQFFQKPIMKAAQIASPKTLRKYLKSLHDAGWITIIGQTQDSDGNWGANCYVIHLVPVDRSKQQTNSCKNEYGVGQKLRDAKNALLSNTNLRERGKGATPQVPDGTFQNSVASSNPHNAVSDADWNADLDKAVETKEALEVRIEAENPTAKATTLSKWIESADGQRQIEGWQLQPRIAAKGLATIDYIDAAYQMYNHWVSKSNITKLAMKPTCSEVIADLGKWVASDLMKPIEQQKERDVQRSQKRYISNDLDAIQSVMVKVYAAKDKSSVHDILAYFEPVKYEKIKHDQDMCLAAFKSLLTSNKIEADLVQLKKLRKTITNK